MADGTRREGMTSGNPTVCTLYTWVQDYPHWTCFRGLLRYAMPQLWMVPVDASMYKATLSRPVDLTAAPDKPAEFPDRARVCGIRTDSEKGEWERNRLYLQFLTSGDHVLVFDTSKGRFTGSGRVGPRWQTEYVRDRFWDGDPATDVFALEEYLEVGVPRVTVNRILEYDLDFYPRGFSKVADGRPIGRVLTHFALEYAQKGHSPAKDARASSR